MANPNQKNADKEEMMSIYARYLGINSFVAKHNFLSYAEFDHYIVNDLSLFMADSDFDFKLLETKINKIIETLPAIESIFARPLLHLKEEVLVMPVEAIHRIDNDTFNHIFAHSELWDNLQENNIKPAKLLTKTHQDNYSIYENLIFCDTIDSILSFSRHNLRLLQDFIFTRQTIDLNLLDRNNHLYYFLSLGKLHTGYIRWFDNFSDIIQRNFCKLNYIHDEISTKLDRPVYRKNASRPKKRKLQKTNILSMHKNYHKIYSLLRFFERKEKRKMPNLGPKRTAELKDAYFYFCQILTTFAISHFNFVMIGEQFIDFEHLDIQFAFKSWNIRVHSLNVKTRNMLKISIEADRKYDILLIPSIGCEALSEIKQEVRINIFADEYVLCTPYTFDESPSIGCCLSIADIDSFRRLQQILLRGMILTDTKRKECPFCNQKLHNRRNPLSKNHVYACDNCKTIITDTICPETDKPYTHTMISNWNPNPLRQDDFHKQNRWLFYKKLESMMFFRNITPINEYQEIICPHCHKVHDS